MISHLLFYVLLILAVGAVTLALSEPLERTFRREFSSYLLVVGGGIAVFTVVIMLLSAIFIS